MTSLPALPSSPDLTGLPPAAATPAATGAAADTPAFAAVLTQCAPAGTPAAGPASGAVQPETPAGNVLFSELPATEVAPASPALVAPVSGKKLQSDLAARGATLRNGKGLAHADEEIPDEVLAMGVQVAPPPLLPPPPVAPVMTGGPASLPGVGVDSVPALAAAGAGLPGSVPDQPAASEGGLEATPSAVEAISTETKTALQLPAAALLPGAEKNAAAGLRLPRATRDLTRQAEAKVFLNADNKGLESGDAVVGTEAAKPSAKMPAFADQPLFSAKPAEPALGVTAIAAGSVVAEKSTSVSPAAETKVIGQATDAVGVVHEIMDMSAEFRVRERSSVEVQFHLKDDAQLSVRVALRDGDVHTTFRTDSPEMRDALSREWRVQAGAAAGETRPYRLAEPTFAPASASSNQAGTGLDQRSSSGQQQSSSSRAESPFASFNRAGGRGDAATPARPVAASRPDTVRHLHAFA